MPSENKSVWLLLPGPLMFGLVLWVFPLTPSVIKAANAADMPGFAPVLALATLTWVFVWWIMEAVPLAVTALLPPLIFSVSGILSWEKSLSSFTNPILWIFMAGFVFAAALKKTGLDNWLVGHISGIYKGQSVFLNTFFVVALPVFLLSFTGSITASAAVVYPLLLSYFNQLRLNHSQPYQEAALLLLGQAASASAMLLLISTPPNIVAKSLLDKNGVFEVNFLNWFLIGTPHAIIGLIIASVFIFIVLKPESEEVKAIFRRNTTRLVPVLPQLTVHQKVVAGLILFTMVLWFLPSALQLIFPDKSPGIQFIKTIMPEAMPAVLAIFLFAIIRVKKEPLLSWPEIAAGIDWGVIFLFGGGIVLGLGIEKSGLAFWLADVMSNLLGSVPGEYGIFAFSAILGFVLSYVASNTAAALIACPIAISMATAAGLPIEPPVIAAALACSISTSIPSTTPPMAIIYSSGKVSILNMFKVGMLSDLVRLGLLLLMGPWLIKLALGIL